MNVRDLSHVIGDRATELRGNTISLIVEEQILYLQLRSLWRVDSKC